MHTNRTAIHQPRQRAHEDQATLLPVRGRYSVP